MRGIPISCGRLVFFVAVLAVGTSAAKAGIACRYRDNGDETATDYDTGVQWARLNSPDGVQWYGNPLDVDNRYTWSSTSTLADGAAFTDCLSRLNRSEAPTSAMPRGIVGFAGHTDWRLPTRDELVGIVDLTFGSPTIDPIFGPTVANGYWSATTFANSPSSAWYVGYGNKGVDYDGKGYDGYARAARTGL